MIAGDAALARSWASTDSGWMRFHICASAKAPTTRICRRRTPSSRRSGRSSTPMRPASCCSPRPISGRKTCSAYFGDGDECHMAYHFPLMPRIYMAIAQEDRFPIADILRQTPDIPDELPMGAVPAQSRRADARNGDRRRARLPVVDLCHRSARAHQSRHPAPAGAADGQ